MVIQKQVNKSRNKKYIGIVLHSYPNNSETFFLNKFKCLNDLGFRVTIFVDQKEDKKSKANDKSKSNNAKNNNSNKNKKAPREITKVKANKIIKNKINELLAEKDYSGYSESSLTSIAKAKYLHALGRISNDQLEQIVKAYKP